jgi:hypothetical protein
MLTELYQIMQDLKRGVTLRHEVEPGLDISVYPESNEDEIPGPGAYIHIGGIGGNVLGLRFGDNEDAAHFFLGFRGIREVTEM